MIADVIAYDRDDRPVLVAAVKAFEMALEDVPRAIDHIAYPGWWLPPRFLMLADYGSIRVIESAPDGSRSIILELPTAEVLGHYDEEVGEMFQKQGIYHPYLRRLVEGWLRDLAYHWKSPTPPASADLEKTGLLALLDGGTTRSGVEFEPDFVH